MAERLEPQDCPHDGAAGETSIGGDLDGETSSGRVLPWDGLDPDEVREWLADSESRRDIPGPVDDPARIAERIKQLRETER